MGLRIGLNDDKERCLFHDEAGRCHRVWDKQELLNASVSQSEIDANYCLVEDAFPKQQIDGYGPHHRRLYLEKAGRQVLVGSGSGYSNVA